MPQAWEKSEWVNTRKVWHNPVFVLFSSTSSLSASITQCCFLWASLPLLPPAFILVFTDLSMSSVCELVLTIICVTNKYYCINITWKTYSGKRRSLQFKYAMIWEAVLFWNRRGYYKNHPLNCSSNHFHVCRPYLSRQHRVQNLKYILFPNSSTSLQHVFKIVVNHSTQVQIHLTNSYVYGTILLTTLCVRSQEFVHLTQLKLYSYSEATLYLLPLKLWQTLLQSPLVWLTYLTRLGSCGICYSVSILFLLGQFVK